MNRVLGAIFDSVWQVKKTDTELIISPRIKCTSLILMLDGTFIIYKFLLSRSEEVWIFYFQTCLWWVTWGEDKNTFLIYLKKWLINSYNSSYRQIWTVTTAVIEIIKMFSLLYVFWVACEFYASTDLFLQVFSQMIVLSTEIPIILLLIISKCNAICKQHAHCCQTDNSSLLYRIIMKR